MCTSHLHVICNFQFTHVMMSLCHLILSTLMIIVRFSCD